MADKTFTITCTMEERWINQFMSFLDYMEDNGKIGHSCRVGFYADGDGDFRPTFVTDVNWERENAPMTVHTDKKFEMEYGKHCRYNEATFDAG